MFRSALTINKYQKGRFKTHTLHCTLGILLLSVCATQLANPALANTKPTSSSINTAHHEEVCSVILKKLKFSFEKLRSGNVTDSKTTKVANLIQTYRLFNCENDAYLFDVLACTNSRIMFLEECRDLD